MTTKVKTIEGSLKIKQSDNLSIWNRATTSNSEWPDKEEFLDVVYWMRQVIGVLLGLFWGLAAFKGVSAILLYALLNVGIIYLYTTHFQIVDEEEYGGTWEIVKEGFVTSFACFLVTWIIMYTGLHQDLKL